jgi:hypothetical protein
MKLKNNYERLKKELEQLKTFNYSLYEILKDLNEYTKTNFNLDIVLTHIFRTKEEQETFYGKGTKKISPHQLWHSVDIRTFIFTHEQISQIEDYINNKYNKNNYYRWTCKNHYIISPDGTINFGNHFHFQFVMK